MHCSADVSPIHLLGLDAAAPDAVERLLDDAFGSDRHTRTAYRLREGTTPIRALSLTAWQGAALIGALQCWPVGLRLDCGGTAAMVLVGPVAVAPAHQGAGVGRRMVDATLAAADRGAHPHGDALMMVGDPEYYGRFGFSADATAGWRMPGPLEPRRLLARLTNDRCAGLAGMLGPR